MASLAGLKAEHGLVPYTVAKHAVPGLTQNIAVQYAAQNIRGNAICPYYVETPLLNAAPDEVYKAWIAASPAKRFCKPEEVAKYLFTWQTIIQVIAMAHSSYWMLK